MVAKCFLERLVVMHPDVKVDLPEGDMAVLAACGAHMNSRATQMVASPLGRFGYTGSRLYWARFNEVGGRRFVVKTHDLAPLTEELNAVLEVRTLFDDAEAITESPIEAGGRFAIIYKLWWHSSATIREYRETVFDSSGIDIIDEDFKQAEVLRSLYSTCLETAHQGERANRDLGSEYQWYLRGGLTDGKLAAAFNRITYSEKCNWLTVNFPDPRLVQQRLLERTLSCRIGAVHGDLHPNNIVFDGADQPHLIDFAWASGSGHIMKDFVLMESSLRFLLFPTNTNPEIQLQVDIALLDENGPQLLADIAAGCPHASYYRRLGVLLEVIRTSARTAGGTGYSFEEYLHAQFLVLYGLLKYEVYRFHDGVRALGMIGEGLI